MRMLWIQSAMPTSLGTRGFELSAARIYSIPQKIPGGAKEFSSAPESPCIATPRG